MIRAFIQARMSSERFPGKVLAPFKGRPIIAHVIAQVARVIPADRITVATSTEPSDDPLACYVREIGTPVYRGALNNVLERFQSCLRAYPCTWFFRLCAGSPLLDSALLQAMLASSDRPDVDLVTNVYPRTFPKGQSAEMVKTSVFLSIEQASLTPDEKEHVTKVYYDHPTAFRIINIASADPGWADASFAVDTLEDLYRLESIEPIGSVGPIESFARHAADPIDPMDSIDSINPMDPLR
jgi:spore coat polysaccharide biosynthesis protein SpsF